MTQQRPPSVGDLAGRLGALSLLLLFLLVLLPIWLVVVYAILGKTDMIAGTVLLAVVVAFMVATKRKNRPRP
jgi:hypothetical protein